MSNSSGSSSSCDSSIPRDSSEDHSSFVYNPSVSPPINSNPDFKLESLMNSIKKLLECEMKDKALE